MCWRTLVAVVVLNGFCVGAARAADDYGRNAWNYSSNGRSGSFTRNDNGWIEEFEFKGKDVSGRGRDRYAEAARTDEYVELTGERSRSVRLYADHADKRAGEGDWNRLSAGAWAAAPSIAGTAAATGARPAKSGAGSASQKAPPQVWSFTKGNKTGNFTKTAEGWDQQIDTKVNDRVVSEHRQFREQSRTSDYVELTDGQDFTIRLYADRAEVDSGNDTWRTLYNGSWDTSAVTAAPAVAGAGQSTGANGGSRRPAQGATEERNVWKYENQKNSSGTIRRTANGWTEEKQVNLGAGTRREVMMYRELNSTPDYIEMIDDRRNVINRIYSDHTEWRFGNGPWNKEFQGSWVPGK